MTPTGFVLVHRSLLGHYAFRNDAEAMAFAWLIARASWQPTRVRYKGHVIELARSELAISVRDMAEALERPKGWVERLISRLKSETMIETRAGTAARTAPLVISITNYDTYQSNQDSTRTASRTPSETAARTGPGQQPDTEQRREQGNKGLSNDKPPRRERVKASPIVKPDDVEQAVWDDFDRLRRTKQAPLTQTALDGIKREAVKAGWTLNEALRECCNRGWQGFKADWVNKDGSGRNAGYRNGNGSARKSSDGFANALGRAAEFFGPDHDG